MTELKKLEAGLEYSFFDDEVNARKQYAIGQTDILNGINQNDEDAIAKQLIKMFGSAKGAPWVGPGFHCDYGKNIHVGVCFIANYNVTILDIAPVHIGDYCMIGPNTLITTVGHPLLPSKRRNHLAQAKDIKIGNDVWIGGNVTILPGVSIGNNVVIGAGSVVSHDIEDNSLVVGIPAKVIKKLENDLLEKI